MIVNNTLLQYYFSKFYQNTTIISFFSKKFFCQNIYSNKLIFPKNYFHRCFSKYNIFRKILLYVVKNDILYSQLHFNIFLFLLSFNY